MNTDRAVDIIAERLPLTSKLTAEVILDDLRAAGIHLADGPCPYVVVADGETMYCRLAESSAQRLQQLIGAVRDLHWHENGWCGECGYSWPCRTVRVIDKIEAVLDAASSGEGE